MNLQQWLDYQQNVHPKTIDLGLERINAVYNKLFPKGITFKVITIAGTNGKGSTGCFASSILSEAHINYGWFSSPHINKYNERFVINDNLASDEEIIAAFEVIEQAREDITLSYFEYSTLAALLIFSAKNVDVAILEIGLGGRLDSVNVVANNVSIITSISLDHTKYLGDTIQKIAVEKAGIIKPNTTCIIPNNLAPVVQNVITDTTQQRSATLAITDAYTKELSMQGTWQQYNASLAQCAITTLFDIDTRTITKGLQRAKIPARAELIHYQTKEFIFDTAHNPEAVKNLASIIPKDSIAIFAAFGDKDIHAMIRAMDNKIDTWVIFPITDSRALKNEELHQYFDDNYPSIVCNSATEAVSSALSLHNKHVVVFGSFLTINAVRKAISL